MNSIVLAVMMIGFVGFLAYLAYDTWLYVKKASKSGDVDYEKCCVDLKSSAQVGDSRSHVARTAIKLRRFL